MLKTTLKTRLIILMAISSIFLISAFTAIQLNNQLQRAAEFNLYRAKLGAFIVKEKLLCFSPEAAAEPEDAVRLNARRVFSSLAESNVIEKAAILDRNGTTVVSEGMEKETPAYDRAVLSRIAEIEDKSRWLFPFVDKKRREATLFVKSNNTLGYTAKIIFSLGNFEQALNEVYGPVIFTVAIVVVGNLIFATILSRTLISPVRLLNTATKDIAKGDLTRKVSIKTQDELEELADTFNYMTVELAKMKAIAENANPLTKLPGNIVIREEVEKRIEKSEKFVLIYCDLDNFKAFNDKYGVHAGDQAIILTATILKEAMVKEGKADDFIGHEGGDDFLLLTTPDRAERIGHYIIDELDKRVRTLYSEEDLKRGYIEAKSRDSGEAKKFPVMTISLAGVTNLERTVNSYAQLTNIAANVKKWAKAATGKDGKLLIDRRVSDLGMKRRGKSASGTPERKNQKG